MTRKLKDKTGNRYERLVVTSYAESRNGKTYWNVRCDCGNIGTARGDRLELGKKKSCGCLLKEKRNENLKPLRVKNKKLYAILYQSVKKENHEMTELVLNLLKEEKLSKVHETYVAEGEKLYQHILKLK